MERGKGVSLAGVEKGVYEQPDHCDKGYCQGPGFGERWLLSGIPGIIKNN